MPQPAGACDVAPRISPGTARARARASDALPFLKASVSRTLKRGTSGYSWLHRRSRSTKPTARRSPDPRPERLRRAVQGRLSTAPHRSEGKATAQNRREADLRCRRRPVPARRRERVFDAARPVLQPCDKVQLPAATISLRRPHNVTITRGFRVTRILRTLTPQKSRGNMPRTKCMKLKINIPAYFLGEKRTGKLFPLGAWK